MQTETWIERLLIDQLTTHDRRYKHDYAGVEKTTDDFVVACTQLDAITTEGGSEEPPLEELLSMDSEFGPEVETALQTLQERGLVECVGERERSGPSFESGDYGTTTLWKSRSSAKRSSRSPERMESFRVMSNNRLPKP